MPDTSANRSKTDPATFEVVKNSLLKAAEEMKIVLAKTAYSPVLKVAGDYSCGIFDAKGDLVAQGPDLPIHLGSMPDAVRAVIQLIDGIGGDHAATEAILEHCRDHLSGYQVPRGIDFDDGLPRTETGKLARRTIRARYWEGREKRV